MQKIQRITIERYMSYFEKRNVKMGEVLLKQGDPIKKLYIIKCGEFELEFHKMKNIETYFDINYYMNFSEIFRFTKERDYEIKGVYQGVETHKVFDNF